MSRLALAALRTVARRPACPAVHTAFSTIAAQSTPAAPAPAATSAVAAAGVPVASVGVPRKRTNAKPSPNGRLTIDQANLFHLSVVARGHVWSTEVLLKSLQSLTDEEFGRDVGLPFGSVHGTLAHLVAADRLWLQRMQLGVKADTAWATPLWADGANGSTLQQWMPSRAEVEAQLLQGCRDVQKFALALNTNGLTQMQFEYRNTRGDQLRGQMSLILTHMCNHGTHHRGQASAALTILGRPAPAMDLLYMLNDKA